MFFECGGNGETYDLSILHINDIYDENGDLEDYPDPNSEYLRVLNPNSSKTEAMYCYVSPGYVEDNADDADESQWAIGWWEWVRGAKYTDLINDGDSELKLKEEVDIPSGRGFMGNFTQGHSLSILFPGATSVPSKQ